MVNSIPRKEKLLSFVFYFSFRSVQLLSRVQLFATPWTAARQACLFITNSQSLFKLTSIESVMPSNHLILCRPLLLLPSIFPSIRAFNQWVNSSHKLELQHQSFQWIFRTDFLYDGLVGSPCSPRESQESSPTPQSKSTNSLALRPDAMILVFWMLSFKPTF